MKKQGYIIYAKIGKELKELGEYYRLPYTLKIAGETVQMYDNVIILHSPDIG